jgi:tetratricopeptide (TPR) repeat protein
MRTAPENRPADRLGRVLTAFLVVVVASAARPTIGMAQDFPEPEIEPYLAVGREVVLKDPNTPMRAGEWLAVSRNHLVFEIVAVRGEQLLLAPQRDKDHRGWVQRWQVVALDGAIDYFSREIARSPNNDEAFWMRAQVWAYRSADERAIADLDRAIEIKPDRAEYYARRGLLHLRCRALDRAMADGNKAIALDPTAPGPRILRAAVAMARGDADLARKDLDEAIRLDPLRPPAGRSQPNSPDPAGGGGNGGDGLLALATQDGEGSGPSASRKETEPEPKTAAEYLDRGQTYFSRKEYRQAIDSFTAAIKLEPKAASSYALRAQVWGARRDRDREVADLNTALRLDPSNTNYFIARAQSWSSQGWHEPAMADYNEAIRLKPNDASLYVARGNEWRRHLKLDQALDDYNRAIQVDPQYVHAYICRAMITKQRRDFPHAVAELIQISQMAPDNAEVHRLLARILATCDNEAVRDGRRAVAEATRSCELTNWSDPDSLDTLAASYAESGDYESAVDWQLKAIELFRKEAITPLQRAMNFGGRRGVGFDDRLAFYKRRRPTRE